VRYNRRENTGGQQSQVSLSAPKAAEPSTMPFAQRLTCTIHAPPIAHASGELSRGVQTYEVMAPSEPQGEGD
jgi:hypothetical protein